MSLHKLTAGSGYDYLTRQVAALDATDKGHTGLASYYGARGESPGRWVGSGLTGIAGLEPGAEVTAEQMQALFGEGRHPLAADIRAAVLRSPAGLAEAEAEAAGRLGAPFRVYSPDVTSFRQQVAARVAGANREAGLPPDWPVAPEERARLRTEVATEFFRREHGRDPLDSRELAATVARESRPRTTAVAGYDLTFSPVKSVSTLWALADPPIAAQVEAAHHAAVAAALQFIERHALFTRQGANGVRQVETRGLVAAAFDHRDSRAGDPDLHTHVAVANKVQSRDGSWLAIDGRVLFKAAVTASETYNTALEHELSHRLGVRFAVRAQSDLRKRPVREVAGVDEALNALWSARRRSIETRQHELVARFQGDHGRPPTPVETVQLAQRATLETRDAKHEPRSYAEQRATWRAQALEVLGSPRRLRAMISATLHPGLTSRADLDGAQLGELARTVVERVEEQRATWQRWHIRAEAQRQVRGLTSGRETEGLVDAIEQRALAHHSVALAPPADEPAEPDLLRRIDGTSVYHVAGSDSYTSRQILAAEQRLVEVGSRVDGRRLDPGRLHDALRETPAEDPPLDPGQRALVTQLATSGRRLQLAVAPAGAGKTTALAALAAVWTGDGGDVIGLAPSAAAADQLATHAHLRADTLAKLTWSIRHDAPLPDWAEPIGPRTLLLIDEAGMADTLSLDTAVRFALDRGASVRLIGDDQQLTAIGAGGVLRDLASTHGAVRLHQLHRFTDPAEAAASLALREGRLEALGFYLDQGRVHVGDLATLADQVLTAWQFDREQGLDAVMLAPTRDLVTDLNVRARLHRLHSAGPSGAELELSDGSRGSAGDIVVTRSNDRRLRLGSTDWVKNGDRWTVLALTGQRGLHVQHLTTGRSITLPADYVRQHVELGYASTVHTAQGLTADTMHGLADGRESRQQLYTMLTRGRTGNHLYLAVVGDGDPHTVIHPDSTHPATPTEILEQILARDESPRSATTLRRDQADPARRLGDACDRYRDALQVAADQLAGPDTQLELATTADQLVPALTNQPAWPTLRSHLLLHALHGTEPSQLLLQVVAQRDLDNAIDPAAILDARLDDTPLRRSAPLPWLPGLPPQLVTDPQWGGYLQRRASLIAHLAERIRTTAVSDTGRRPWLDAHGHRASPQLTAELEVWRAANHVDRDDQRPTGPRATDHISRAWQDHLHHQLATTNPAVREWTPRLVALHQPLGRDPFTPTLAGRLAAASRAGNPVAQLVSRAAAEGPLPDDHSAAALWWRLTRALPQTTPTDLATPTVGQLANRLRDADQAAMTSSHWWPALTDALQDALQRGWTLDDLLPSDQPPVRGLTEDPALALLQRIAILTSDPGTTADNTAPPPAERDEAKAQPGGRAATQEPRPAPTGGDTTDAYLQPDLAVAALVRQTLPAPQPSQADLDRAYLRACVWDDSPVPRTRLLAVNELAAQFYESQLPGSWSHGHLRQRLHTDLAGHAGYRPGHAPAGWTSLLDHLHRHGVTDEELLTAGLATTTRSGRLIDRFRDRLVLPVTSDGHVLGFVGRRNPEGADLDRSGPKYLNTPDTPLFRKGAQLYGRDSAQQGATSRPTLVEGPLDAIAITLATHGSHLGLAPLGTALTRDQARELAAFAIDPIIATDNDPAGRAAATRTFWMLSAHRLDPLHVLPPPGSDPAELLQQQGPGAVRALLHNPQRLGATLLAQQLSSGDTSPSGLQASAHLTAARPASTWSQAIDTVSAALDLPDGTFERPLLAAVRAWNEDPDHAAQEAMHARPLQPTHPAETRKPQHHPDRRPNSRPTQPINPSAPGT